jgi:hypothetical protein
LNLDETVRIAANGETGSDHDGGHSVAGSNGSYCIAVEPVTTTPVQESTRGERQRLKTGGQSYDAVIRAILEEPDPWFAEMEQRAA